MSRIVERHHTLLNGFYECIATMLLACDAEVRFVRYGCSQAKFDGCTMAVGDKRGKVDRGPRARRVPKTITIRAIPPRRDTSTCYFTLLS